MGEIDGSDARAIENMHTGKARDGREHALPDVAVFARKRGIGGPGGAGVRQVHHLAIDGAAEADGESGDGRNLSGAYGLQQSQFVERIRAWLVDQFPRQPARSIDSGLDNGHLHSEAAQGGGGGGSGYAAAGHYDIEPVIARDPAIPRGHFCSNI
jgi:hypothetical protein